MEIAFDTPRTRLTPLILCGVARSGTRMISDILNAHPNILVEAEMHAKTIEAYFAFLDQVQQNFDHYSARKGYALDKHWQRSQTDLHHLFFATAGKRRTSLEPGTEIKYHGLKTPGYERYFEQFEAMFKRQPPLYVYALRQPGAVWRSWVTRGFDASFDTFLTRYQRSLRQALAIKTAAPERLALFNLDAYIAADDKPSFVTREVLEKLDLPAFKVWPEGGVANNNSARALGLTLVDSPEITAQIAQLNADRKIRVYREKLLASA
jgi:hypothetical protein